ncbi:hypothetical protein RX717_12860 [Intestinibacillus sp. NTUH-41-i26]|uniref:hypothetical protein n=1 Tax=Intestinibacillus sp. NTUH-41-i26 TaxID=3079303 RepID=UPI002934B691|nr:hypothetical protein [Intestinibacillus sp. NTUH-41-i26]WOC74859.1 hypothetical protein RX717_12860 [Intestinibacillus sp. NTUH-41-i26]
MQHDGLALLFSFAPICLWLRSASISSFSPGSVPRIVNLTISHRFSISLQFSL